MAFFSFAKVIMSSFFKKHETYLYPAVRRSPVSRGSVKINIDGCIFCGICSNKCPVDAIRIDKTNKTWEILSTGCVLCNSCVEACPKKCLIMNTEPTPVSNEIITEKISQGFGDA
jgi:formate hydrogenlyase subunit 6/NADH:ubiquinone oxidoreductase subunit I